MPLNRARRFVVTFTLHFFLLVSEGKLAATATGTDRNLFHPIESAPSLSLSQISDRSKSRPDQAKLL